MLAWLLAPRLAQFLTRHPGIGLVVLLVVARVSVADEVTVRRVPEGLRPEFARVDAQGTIHLVAHADGGLRYCQSRDGGRTFSSPTPVVRGGEFPPGLEFEVWDVVVSDRGDVHVALGTNAWKLKRPHAEWGLYYARRRAAAGDFEPVRNLNARPSEGFALALSPTGTLTATWLADRLFANVSRDRGDTFEATVEFDPSANPCDCCTTSAAYGADGRLAVLYREETNNDRDMFVALWNQQTRQVTRRKVSRQGWHVDACPMTYYSIVAAGEGYLAAWPTRGEVHFTRLTAEGEPTAIRERATGGQAGMRSGIIAVPGPEESQWIAWKKEGQLHWQAYDREFQPRGRPAQIASPGTGAPAVRWREQFVLFR